MALSNGQEANTEDAQALLAKAKKSTRNGDVMMALKQNKAAEAKLQEVLDE
jgi:hypothetical protein